jgi:hypothetical protein
MHRHAVIGLTIVAFSVGRVATGWGADDPAAARQEAKKLSDSAGEALERGDVAGALADFRRAYALFPSANLRFNIGEALDELGRAAEAVDSFEEFLAEAPDAPAAARQLAADRVAELGKRIARLELEVTPAGADVTVDGLPVTLPRTRPLPVMPGAHTVMAHRQGLAPVRMRVAVVAGERRVVALSLSPGPSPTPGPVATTPPLLRHTTDDVDHGRRARRLGWAALGVGAFGVASLAVGATFAGLTASIDRRVNDPPPGVKFDRALADEGRRDQALTQAFLVIGGAAVATGVVLVVLRARERRHPAMAAQPIARLFATE